MPRVKRGVTAHARHKKVLDLAKGYRGRRKNVYRVAKEAVMKAGQYAYRDRRQKKRQFRALWIARINAAAREHGVVAAPDAGYEDIRKEDAAPGTRRDEDGVIIAVSPGNAGVHPDVEAGPGEYRHHRHWRRGTIISR